MQADSLPAEPPGKPKNTGVGSLSLLQWLFPTQESNGGLLHCRQILYQLNYQGSPFTNEEIRILGGEAVSLMKRAREWLVMGSVRPQFSSVEFSRSVVSDSVTPWIAALQASLSITNSRSLPKLMSMEWSCMDVRVGVWRKLSTEDLMLLNCGVGEDSWESLGLQEYPTSPS